jgi:hypothetical protein
MLNTTILSLAPADASISAEGKVLSSFAMVKECAKKIEPAGKAYAKLQGKIMRFWARLEEAKANGTDVVEESDDEGETTGSDRTFRQRMLDNAKPKYVDEEAFITDDYY